MFNFRWSTKVVSGPWHATRDRALVDAVKHGQALMSVTNRIILRDFAAIEKRRQAA